MIQRERARKSVRGHDTRRVVDVKTQRSADEIRRNAIHMQSFRQVDAIDGIKGLGKIDEDRDYRESRELVADLIHSPKSKYMFGNGREFPD